MPEGYKLFVNAERTVQVRIWPDGEIEVSTRPEEGAIWGPLIRPDERMVEAVAIVLLHRAFATLDRDTLIGAGSRGAARFVSQRHVDEDSRRCAEAVLRAVGLIS